VPSRSTICGKPQTGTLPYVYNITYDTLKRLYTFVGFVTICDQFKAWSKII